MFAFWRVDKLGAEIYGGESMNVVETAGAGARTIFADNYGKILKRTDRLFAGLMAFQWVGGLVAAPDTSPRAIPLPSLK